MNKSEIEKRLEELKSLIHDYSIPERRTETLLIKIDELLEWARAQFIKDGMSDKEVKKILGEPPVIIEGTDADSNSWLYPCAAMQRSQSDGKFGINWFMQLEFRAGKLRSIEKRQWHFSKE